MPTNSLRVSATAALLLSFLISIATPSFAQSEHAQEAKHRINLSGSLRMLSQRISMAGCLIYSGVEVDENLALLARAEGDFTKILHALRIGDTDLGLNTETDPHVLSALKVVEHQWSSYDYLISGVVVNGSIDSGSLLELAEVGDGLLESMATATNYISQTYGGQVDELPLILAVTIDFAGRQRMLMQKMSKEFCLIDAGVDVAGNRTRLSETLGIYNATLSGLVNGYPGVLLLPPSDDIGAKLDELSVAWQLGNETFSSIAAGSEITDANREVVASDVKNALGLMNEAVKMYEMVEIDG